MAAKRATGFGDRTTNYRDAFIEASPSVSASRVPEKPDSVAHLQYRLIAERPYQLTSDDVIFGAYAERNQIPVTELAAAREVFFSKPQSCLRASPLVKTHGWGIHHDGEGRVALVAQGDKRYAALSNDPDIAVIKIGRRM